MYGLAEDRLTRLGEAKPPFLDRLGAEAQTYIAVMQSAVLDAALHDDVVLLGRGGQWLLRGIAHVVRVRTVAPFDERVRRVAERVAGQIGGRNGVPPARDAVEQLVRRDDADKRGRMRYLYDCDLDDPLLYDVVMNSGRADAGAAVDAIVVLAQRADAATTATSVQQLVDRAVASSVRVALMLDEHTRGYAHYDVESANGVIRVTSRAPATAVEAVARSVAGVRDVHVAEMPAIPSLPLG